jgi:hypothetical protein
MTIIDELAAWAPGENSFTALAEAANLRVKPSRFAGVSTPRMRNWVLKGRSDIDVTMRCVALSQDGAFLTKMAKDRRVNVRLAVLDNPSTPIAVLEEGATQNKNWDIRHKAETQISLRVRAMDPEAAFALIDDSKSHHLLEMVVQHPKLNDEQLRSVIGREVVVPGRHGSPNTVNLGRLAAGRNDLKRLEIETLWALAANGSWVEVAQAVAARNDEAELVEFVERLKGASDARRTHSAQQALGIIARKQNLTTALSEKLFAITEEDKETGTLLPASRVHLLGTLAANPSVAWDLFMNEPVKTASAQALARAMADTFSDDPAVWLLAVELAENQITIGEMLTVLSSTFPNALKSVE